MARVTDYLSNLSSLRDTGEFNKILEILTNTPKPEEGKLTSYCYLFILLTVKQRQRLPGINLKIIFQSTQCTG